MHTIKKKISSFLIMTEKNEWEREKRETKSSQQKPTANFSARASERQKEIERLSIFLRRTVCGLPECFYCMPKISCCSLYWTSNSQLLLFLIWAALVFSNSFFILEGVERICCFFFFVAVWSFPCLRSLLLLLHLFFVLKCQPIAWQTTHEDGVRSDDPLPRYDEISIGERLSLSSLSLSCFRKLFCLLQDTIVLSIDRHFSLSLFLHALGRL